MTKKEAEQTMHKALNILILLAVFGCTADTAQGTVTAINEVYYRNYQNDTPLEEFSWDFDYGLQELTLSGTVSNLDDFQDTFFFIDGGTDSDSQFSVFTTLINNTGITWTGYTLIIGYGVANNAGVLWDSFTSTKLGDITVDQSSYKVEFSGEEPVLAGESFTFGYEMDAHQYINDSFLFNMYNNPVPEPATLLLLGTGGLFLRNRRKQSRS